MISRYITYFLVSYFLSAYLDHFRKLKGGQTSFRCGARINYLTPLKNNYHLPFLKLTRPSKAEKELFVQQILLSDLR